MKVQNPASKPELGRVATQVRRARAIGAIAEVTFREILRDKVLYNIVLFAVLLLGMGFLASRLTFVRPERVVLDFGMSALNVACAMIAIFGGATLLPREFERRTLTVALSRPISRSLFVLGKFLGLAAILALNTALLAAAFFIVLGFTGDGLAEAGSPTLLIALGLLLIQSWLIAALAVFFSSWSTASVAAVSTIGLYLVGNNVSQIRFVAAKIRSPMASATIEGLSLFLPNLEYFNLGTKVTYGLPVSGLYLLGCLSYAALWLTMILWLSGWLVRLREL